MELTEVADQAAGDDTPFDGIAESQRMGLESVLSALSSIPAPADVSQVSSAVARLCDNADAGGVFGGEDPAIDAAVRATVSEPDTAAGRLMFYETLVGAYYRSGKIPPASAMGSLREAREAAGMAQTPDQPMLSVLAESIEKSGRLSRDMSEMARQEHERASAMDGVAAMLSDVSDAGRLALSSAGVAVRDRYIVDEGMSLSGSPEPFMHDSRVFDHGDMFAVQRAAMRLLDVRRAGLTLSSHLSDGQSVEPSSEYVVTVSCTHVTEASFSGGRASSTGDPQWRVAARVSTDGAAQVVSSSIVEMWSSMEAHVW